MTDQITQQREIAIFWDYENVPLPNWCSATQAAKAIVDAVSHYGRIVDRRLYYDFEKMRYRPRDCSSLDSSGFDLVNTPTRNNKETLDKKLIADVLTFAWDSAVRNDNRKPCVVLLTGDGDYAYTLSKLRDRGIMTVVMVGRDCTVASILVDTADVAMSLEDDVLRDVNAKTSTATSSSLSSKMNTVSPTKFRNASNGQNRLMFSICQAVQSSLATSDDEWTDFGKVSMHIQNTIRKTMEDAPPNVIKEEARKARQKAESSSLIEIGRRKLDSKGNKREIISSNDLSLNLSNEVYVRLLSKGQQLLKSGGSPRNQQNTETQKSRRPMSPVDDTPSKISPQKQRTLFLPRLSEHTDVRDLVTFLEESFHVTVRRARIGTSNASTSCNAHVEFFDEKDAGLVLQAANKAAGGEGIYFGGKYVGAIINTRFNAFSSKGSENTYYESEKLSASSPRTPTPDTQSKGAMQDDTSSDTKHLCLAINLAATKAGQETSAVDSWVNAGSVGGYFRQQLRPAYLKATTKEDINTRFKQARSTSIQDGLLEMGRRHLDGDDYVAVALDNAGTKGGKLSPEIYVRLLPPGQALALEAQSESPPKTFRSKFIFMNGLPRSTTAAQLAQYLESLEYKVQSIELKATTFKGSSAISAHVEFVDTEDATRILRKSKSHGGLVYCGRSIIAAVDRLSPGQVKNTNPDMSYTREDGSENAASVADTDLMDSSLPSESTATGNEEQQMNLIDDTNLIMRRDSSTSDQKDPFEGIEDLINWT